MRQPFIDPLTVMERLSKLDQRIKWADDEVSEKDMSLMNHFKRGYAAGLRHAHKIITGEKDGK